MEAILQPLTHTEREAAILLGFLKATKSMVNKAMLDIHVGEQGAVCRPQTSHTAKLFNIHLVELISPPIRMVGDHKSYISAVQSVTLNPNFNSANSIGMLCQAIDKFQL